VQRFFRTLTEDVQMHDVTMRAGQKVLLIFASADHDQSQFTDPETFDIDRGQNRHVAFGHGVHRCAGAPLAQLELNILAQTMLNKTHFRLTQPPQYGPPTAFGAFLGIDELNITTTP
jgi:cytochrome P450